ncbi:hypothetical protein VOLCADRAFT_63270 [Volvox carteri f. nagariensis]|uniref:Fumarylacetoacetase n=1 Tax=Volvox carteri f. nagariensis TaxID=3068 RepID=D8U370_VOLCA|nr:uncharacterized protein VOLCADRAFT_63270 [Volvox carteri f. nagariensis]EFJ45774.1 hypothetical protein VOLCADRAFT_63270 [Volvox carteri f. nagariensis]|eukprot:XP_002953175.1 hypothetical protein VOLCADRAFT_63270 [Volvox carteri f. nagariensis]
MESFIEVPLDSDFPLENLPWGVFEAPGPAGPQVHVGVALGQHVISATELQLCSIVVPVPVHTRVQGRLNEFMAAGRPAWRAARSTLQRLLNASEGELRDNSELMSRVVHKQADVTMLLPAQIGDYTDFYASRQHATRVGSMFRGPANALNPNWLHLPVGYHGRSSSVVPSGAPVRRPSSAVSSSSPPPRPVVAPSTQVDFELEVAAFIGPGNTLGEAIPVESAWEHVFGLVLMNDWSARDIQKWEYVPLGPFCGKNWATQISPWVVTSEALEPFKCRPPAKQAGDPDVLPYLQEAMPYTYDVNLAVDITPPGVDRATTVTRSNLKHLYWSFAQMIAHHTVGGCNLRPGDLLGSGTISGDEADSSGCLLELTHASRDEIVTEASTGVVRRRYLEDGDVVTLRGWCGGDGVPCRRIGFGRCSGELLPCQP